MIHLLNTLNRGQLQHC